MTHRSAPHSPPPQATRAVIRRVAKACSLVSLVILAAQSSLAQQPPTPQALDAQAAAAAAWPHTIQRESTTVTVYQPQAIAWPDRKRLTARAALSITRPAQPKPLMGNDRADACHDRR